MSDVIDPGAIPIPAVKPEEVDAAGRALKTDGSNIAQTGHDIDSSWQGLSQFYQAPEAELLFAATKPVAAAGDSVKVPTQTAGDALITFAETAKSLVGDLRGLKSKAEAFRGKIDGDDDWREDEDKVNEHNNLNNDILAKLVAYQAAERDCANKITGLFGGTHFVGSDPTADKKLLKNGEQFYGLSKPVKDIETPWAKPQEYDAPWYEDVWNGIKDFGVGIVQDLASLVGMYGEDGWGWQGWDGLLGNWEALAGGLVGLVGLYGPEGWGWQGWKNVGDNWLNLVNGFVPYREWDGGNGAGYTITQGVLNIGSCFIGVGVVKGLMKAGKSGRGGDVDVDSTPNIDVDTHLPTHRPAGELPSVKDLQDSLDDLDLDTGDLKGLDDALNDAGDFDTTNVPDREPAHVGGRDETAENNGNGPNGNGPNGNGPNGNNQPDDTPDSHGEGNDGPNDPPNNNSTGPGDTDPNGPGDTDPGDKGDTDPGGGPDPDTQKKLERADRFEEGLRDGGLTDEQINNLRGDHSRDSREWQRLGSALEQGFGKKIKERLHPQAVDFALDGGRTVDPQTFAHRYEYFKAHFDEQQALVRQQIKDGDYKLAPNKSVLQEAADRLEGMDLKAVLDADLAAVHQVRPHPALVDPNLSGADLEHAVRSSAGDMDMGSDTSAAYHVRKHYDELPAPERTGDPTKDYFDSAERTIRDGEVWRRETLPGGAERIIFRREVQDAVGNSKMMEAIVIVRSDGKALFATYGEAKSK